MSGPSKYTPKSGFACWLERRLPILSFMYDSFVAYPTPKNLNYLWTFGAILSFMLVAQLITGIVLAMHYTPETTLAFDSVEHIMRDVSWGQILRYAHANGASMFFLAVYIHIFRGMYYGSYKEPREVLWILGVFIFLAMMATGFLGYVLPWGQMSFWAATVITNLFSAIPVVGNSITYWLLGGYSVDNPTLNRFFALHYLLPFIIVALVALHVWALHVTGQNNPAGVEVRDVEKETVPFTPHATFKDAFGIGAFLLIYMWLTFFVPNYTGHPDNYIEANPLVTPPHIVPEWYFLPFYAVLRAVPNKLLGVVALFSAVLIPAALPWLDTSKVKSGTYRPWFRKLYWVFIAVCLGLGYLGAQPAEGAFLWAARALSLYYFFHFLILLPWLGRVEKPDPVPESIEAAVAARTASKDAAHA
jgi:ubiquinol-cytochrome c reductase cytochrome b/c1 subunit